MVAAAYNLSTCTETRPRRSSSAALPSRPVPPDICRIKTGVKTFAYGRNRRKSGLSCCAPAFLGGLTHPATITSPCLYRKMILPQHTIEQCRRDQLQPQGRHPSRLSHSSAATIRRSRPSKPICRLQDQPVVQGPPSVPPHGIADRPPDPGRSIVQRPLPQNHRHDLHDRDDDP